MPNTKGPRLYRSDEAPGTPQQGDIQYNVSNNRIECYTGTAWGSITFNTANVVGLTVSAGFVSLNTTTPAFYLPSGAGAITGAVASLGNRVAVAYNTTGRQLMIRDAGSWYTTASLNLA